MGNGRYSEVIAAPLTATNPVQAARHRNRRFRLLAIKSLDHQTQRDFIEDNTLPQERAAFRAQVLALRFATRVPSAERKESFVLLTRHFTPRRVLRACGDMPGYSHPSRCAGLEHTVEFFPFIQTI
jgi:hypothetical protein